MGAKRRRDLKKKRIKQTTQDSEPSSMQHTDARARQNTYLHNRSGKTALFFAECIPVIIIFLIPVSVHAGFLSSIFGVFTEEVIAEEVDEVVDYSAQQTPLLSAQLNSEPLAVGGGDVFVEDGALVSTGPVGEDEIETSKYKNGEIRVYTVDAGDSLSQIAEMYGVTTNTIMWANDLTSRTIREGQVLVILPIVGVQHTVKDGETFGSIVKKYDADFDEVLDYNNLVSADDISVGDELLIPGGEVAAPKRIASAPSPTKTSGSISNVGFTNPAPGATRTQGIHGYNGVDLAGAHGSAIRAAASGEVIVSKNGGWNGGYGSYIVVRHGNGTQTLYAHLSATYVGAGQYVNAGETIAGMGNTGRSTGTHLHFEVRGARNPF